MANETIWHLYFWNLCIVVLDGLNRRAVASCEFHPSCRSSTRRRSGPSLERSTASIQRDPMDPSDGRPLERFAFPVWRVPNGAPQIPTMAEEWRVRAGAPGCGAGFEGSRRLGSSGMFYRWHVRTGQKRGLCVGKTKRGKGSKIMAIADRNGLPIAIHTTSASPAEVTLVADTLDQRFVADVPERLIADKAYDSDRLDETMLSDFGTEIISPHRENRRPENKTQDGRSLRRYVRRWKVERLFAWLNNFRRLVTRWEFHAENYLGFLRLACLVILLRHL